MTKKRISILEKKKEIFLPFLYQILKLEGKYLDLFFLLEKNYGTLVSHVLISRRNHFSNHISALFQKFQSLILRIG